MPEISIILAAYNAEKTINRMLDSIICQTFSDWELIAIDDGSSDSTGRILDNYAGKDNRIRVIHKKNGGVAAARQDGIDSAEGEYTIHADADDWVEPDMLEDMHDVAKKDNADIVIADFFTDANGKSIITIQQPTSLTREDVLYGLYAKGLFGGLWHKLIKKSVYDKASAFFIPGINYCEDLLVLTQILSRTTPKISYIPKAYYHYVVNGESLTQKVSADGLKSMRRFHKEAIKFLPDDKNYQKVKNSFDKNEFTVYFTNRLYSNRSELQEEYRRLKPILLVSSGLRWRIGYLCIGLGWTFLAHRLIRF